MRYLRSNEDCAELFGSWEAESFRSLHIARLPECPELQKPSGTNGAVDGMLTLRVYKVVVFCSQAFAYMQGTVIGVERETLDFSPLLCRLSYPAVMAPIVGRRGIFTMPQRCCRASAPLAAGQAAALRAP